MNTKITNVQKVKIAAILERRDNMTHEDAIELIRVTQAEIDGCLDMDSSLESYEAIEGIVMDNLGLEPDFADAFLY